jgi:PAS domain S-box-containing protein
MHPAEGEMGKLIAAHDWSRSPVGPANKWPPSLATTLGFMLPARAQIVLFWGPQYVAFYNDAYAPTIGDKHPRALGRPASESWTELWDDLEPLLRKVRESGETVFANDRPFRIRRRGYDEQVFFDISYSAVRGLDGGVDGVLCIVSETTQRVLAERTSAAEKEHLAQLFRQAPSFMAMMRGPDHVFEFANAAYERLVGHRDVVGKPIRQALPDISGQGFFELLDKVYATGEPFRGQAASVVLRSAPGAVPEERLLDFIYQPVRDAQGAVTGIFVEGSDVTDRERAIAAQRESEERLRLSTEAGAIGTWDFHPATGELRWDERCKALFGLPPDADVTYEGSFVAGLHPEDRERTERAVADALNPGGTGYYNIEYRTIGLTDGVERWIVATGRTVFAGGKAARFIGTVVDISDQKRAAAALDTESRALETLNRTAAQVAAELNLERLVQTVVDAGVKLTGAQFGAFFYNVIDQMGESYTLYSLSGAPREAFSRFPMPRNTKVFAPTFSGSGTVRSDDITKDPRYGDNAPYRGMPEGHLPVRSYLAVPVVSRTGEVIGGLFFGHKRSGAFDARSERLMSGLAAQAAVGIDNARLFLSAQRLAADLETQVEARTQERDTVWRVSHDLLGIADLNGVWRSVNPAWGSTLGWDVADILGRTSEWITHPDDRASTRAELTRLAQGEATSVFENRFRARDGTYRTLSWTAVADKGAVYTVARDVTEERAQAAALVEAEERLRQAQKMETVGQLTGGIAHDFNNLLQIITGNVGTLLRNLPESERRLRRSAENAMTGAHRAAMLTQRLLAFSRRAPLDPKPTNPNKLVAGMSDLLHRTLGETIQIETVLAPGTWRVEADVNQLESAILNLAVNARDAMPNGGKLMIETANTHLDRDYTAQHAEVTAGQYIVISVSDTGCGMSKEALNRAFEPFFTTKEPGKGTGLGLSMVYGFVKQSGGHVKAYSEPGQGTTIKIYLPRLFGAAPEEEETPTQIVPEGVRDETILVCEDDDDVRAYSVEVLRDLGYRVLEAHDGPSALRLLERQEGRVDLLFTDVVLPSGMTGAVLAENARILRPGLKVLFTTGYARNAIVHHGRLDPGVHLITKPFSYAELASRVRDLLDAV